MVEVKANMHDHRVWLKLDDSELELITNALLVYVSHETDLLEELKSKGAEPGDEGLGDLVGGTLKDSIELRHSIVSQLGYDPTDG